MDYTPEVYKVYTLVLENLPSSIVLNNTSFFF